MPLHNVIESINILLLLPFEQFADFNMKLSTQTFLKALFLWSVVAKSFGKIEDDDNPHKDDPDEIDVDFFPLCETNADGFGGEVTDDSFTVAFWYELTYVPGASVEGMLESIEKGTADFLLKSDLFAGSCDRRKLTVRRLATAVGISSKPDDEVLEGVSCSSGVDDCAVVEGALQVYYTDEIELMSNTNLEEEFKTEISSNLSGIDYANEDIISVVAVDEPGANPDGATGTNGINTDDNSTNSTPIIIGATVGAVLILGAVALYRRRQSGSNDETAFSGNTTAEPV